MFAPAVQQEGQALGHHPALRPQAEGAGHHGAGEPEEVSGAGGAPGGAAVAQGVQLQGFNTSQVLKVVQSIVGKFRPFNRTESWFYEASYFVFIQALSK